MFKAFPIFVNSTICLQCQGCCRFSSRTSEWRPKLSISEQRSYKGFIADDGLSLEAVEDHDTFSCVFLNIGNNECSVYSKRPFECRIYPFLITRRDGSLYLSAHLACPAVQDILDNEEFIGQTEYLRQYLIDNDMLSHLKEDNSLVCEYAEYIDEIKELFRMDI